MSSQEVRCNICGKLLLGLDEPKVRILNHVKSVHAPKNDYEMFHGPKERKKYVGYNYKE
jgi:hypothetical protein